MAKFLSGHNSTEFCCFNSIRISHVFVYFVLYLKWSSYKKKQTKFFLNLLIFQVDFCTLLTISLNIE